MSNAHLNSFQLIFICCCRRLDAVRRPGSGPLRGGALPGEDIREDLSAVGHRALPRPHGLQQLLRPPAGSLGAAARRGQQRPRGWPAAAA